MVSLLHLGGVSGDQPSDASLFVGAVLGDPAPVSFGEHAPEGSGFKILAVGGVPASTR
jgi:hypothetical protein